MRRGEVSNFRDDGMAEKRDYYEVLGVPKTATDAELKKAFYKIAKENHPDLHPGDKECEARLKEAGEAYEVLSDKDKRAKYDQFGFAGVDPSYAAQNGGYGGGFDFSGFGGLDDLFSNIFGGGFGGFGQGRARTRNGPRPGEDIRVGISLSFEEAAFGCDKTVTVQRIETCDECGGSGCAKGATAEVCPDCHGSGVVTITQRTPFGVMQSQGECPKCRGKGKIIHQPCAKCKGAGRIRRNRTENLHIDAGISNNVTIPMSGRGNAGTNGGPSGDLLITVSIRPHDFFERDGNSVLCEIPITVTQAILGAELEVPTLDGKVKYSIPEGTQHGDTFRLRGKGIPYFRSSGRGDQFVTVNVVIPRNLTAEQRELVEKLDATLGGGAPKPRKSKWKK